MAEDVDTLIVVAPGGPETRAIVNAEVLTLDADGDEIREKGWNR